MRVAITGATGLIGAALTRSLRADGHEVVGFTRGQPGPRQLQWQPGARLAPERLADFDGVVHLAGEPIAHIPGTAAHRRRVLDSRRAGTTTIAEAVAEAAAAGNGPGVLLSASAIGYYGDRGDELLTEESGSGDDFLAEVCRVWESSADPARAAGVRVAHPRIGVVQSRRGGALGALLPLFRLGLGGRFGAGEQWMSWVTIDDVVRALRHALAAATLAGPFNLVAPAPVRNADYTATLARVLRRPAVIPVPRFAPRLALGELADSLLFSSQRAQPAALEADGFVFRHTQLEPALRHILRSRRHGGGGGGRGGTAG